MSEPIEVRAFLWDKRNEPPSEADYVPAEGAWWAQFYSGVVASGGLTTAALAELTKSSRAIAGMLPRPGAWTRPRPFKGVVVGAVQSGKTQSMMGVAATAIDNGYRIVIVLAGLKDDLRTQTARRFNEQLLLQSDPIPGVPGGTTLGKPRGPTGEARGFASPYTADAHDYGPLAPGMARALSAGQPCVVVVKKHPTSLGDLQMVLAGIYDEFGAENLPTLILDDECDEATVPGGEQEKAVPESIIRLWKSGGTIPPVAYVGYTATAAANLLQHPNWALYPHWVYLLRYPASIESKIQFFEASSDNCYSGGDCFYSEFGDAPGENDNFLVSDSIDPGEVCQPIQSNGSLLDAFRAYFVGGAYRLALDPGRSFDSVDRLPRPHSMMIHTSAAQEDHWKWAEGILRLFGKKEFKESYGFDESVLWARLEAEEALWKGWYDRYLRSREQIYESRPHDGAQAHVTWHQVKGRLREVFRNVRLKVVNSDEGSGSLDFKPPLDGAGRPLRPPDLYVVAVGGSRLSRGITVEGLCTSYFARTARLRHDDTVLQMCRWFGYRGRYLEFCRIFTTPAAYVGLKEVAENDLQLRIQLARMMEERRTPEEATLAFCASPYALPTAKNAAGVPVDLTFSPYSKMLSRLEVGACAENNEKMALALVRCIRNRKHDAIRRQNGLLRGYLSQGWSFSQVADILDSWEFEGHNPVPEQKLISQYYRPAAVGRLQMDGIEWRSDPYQIAAYLRYWSNVADDQGVGAPEFNVGVGFGELEDSSEPFDFPLLNREVTGENDAVGGWTGRSPNWRGDLVFDNPSPRLLDDRNNRLKGAPGLLLLYVIHKNARGRRGNGTVRNWHAPMFGISIPEGGPTFMRILAGAGVRHA
jgi:hypothetical protein